MSEELDLLEEVKAIQSDRASKYGDCHDQTTNLGLVWTGLIQSYYGIELPHAIPSSLVLTLMASLKLNRISVTGYDRDSFVDAVSYVDLTHNSRIKEENK